MSPRMQERPSTASTCFSSARTGSRRSIRRRGVCSPRSRRPATVVTRGSRGPKGRSGWGSIGTGRSIKSIPKQGRFFARSSPTAVTSVTWIDEELRHGAWEGDESDLRRVDPLTGEVLERLEMPPRSERFGARVRWRRSVLLRRRKERQGEDRPPAEARLRDGQPLRDPRRLHEQIIEAALAGELRYLDEQVLSERAADHPFCVSTSRSSLICSVPNASTSVCCSRVRDRTSCRVAAQSMRRPETRNTPSCQFFLPLDSRTHLKCCSCRPNDYRGRSQRWVSHLRLPPRVRIVQRASDIAVARMGTRCASRNGNPATPGDDIPRLGKKMGRQAGPEHWGLNHRKQRARSARTPGGWGAEESGVFADRALRDFRFASYRGAAWAELGPYYEVS